MTGTQYVVYLHGQTHQGQYTLELARRKSKRGAEKFANEISRRVEFTEGTGEVPLTIQGTDGSVLSFAA